MSIQNLSDILFFWDAIAGVQPVVGGDPTFARASSGLIVPDRNHVVRALPADYPRFPWVTVAGERLPAMLIEPADTNVALDSENFGAASWVDSGTAPTVTLNDAKAPNGKDAADKIEDDSATGFEMKKQSISVANDSSAWCAYVFVRKAASTPMTVLRLSFEGGTYKEADVWLDPATGSIDATHANLDDAGVEDVGDYWLLWCVASNNGSGNTTAGVLIVPAAGSVLGTFDVASTGGNQYWGAGLINRPFPTSYTGETTVSAVTRAAEQMSWNGAPDPQAMVIYLDMVLVNPLVLDNHFFLHIGKADDSDPKLVIENNAADSRIRLRHDPGTSSNAETTLTSPAPGDRVQIVASLEADGNGRLMVSHNNGAPSDNSLTSPQALAASWSEATVSLNGRNEHVNAAKYRQLKIVKPGNLDAAVDGSAGQALLDELASLTVTQYGSVRA